MKEYRRYRSVISLLVASLVVGLTLTVPLPAASAATLDSSDVVCVTNTLHLTYADETEPEFRRYWFALDSSYLDAWSDGEVGFDRDGPCGDFSVEIAASTVHEGNTEAIEQSRILFSNYVGRYNPDQETYSDLHTAIDLETVVEDSTSSCVTSETYTYYDDRNSPEKTGHRYEIDEYGYGDSCMVTQSQNTEFASPHGNTTVMVLARPSDEIPS